MRRAGWRVINFVVTMGRPEHQERRRSEATCAAHEAGFELRTPAAPIAISAADDLHAGLERTRSELREFFADLQPAIVVAPSPHDGHHAHELVGHAVVAALGHVESRPRLWLWGLWADLPFPTIYAPYDDDLMDEAQSMIRCYAGEVARNDYSRLLDSRAQAYSILGAERVFGYGRSGHGCTRYADLLLECLPLGDRWLLGEARVLQPAAEPVEGVGTQDIGWWLESPSPHERRRFAAHSGVRRPSAPS
jgi:LmbE family N-acetylglucosaminyl deacetylase